MAAITNAFRKILGKGASAFFDDIALSSLTKTKHDDLVVEVFETCRHHNLQMNVKKYLFYAEEIEFLGYLVSFGSIRPNPRKVQAILEYPVPKTVKKLQSFLGMTNYYRRFIKNYSQHAKPLTEATSGKISFNFTDKCKEAFEKLKKDSDWKSSSKTTKKLPNNNGKSHQIFTQTRHQTWTVSQNSGTKDTTKCKFEYINTETLQNRNGFTWFSCISTVY